MSSSTCYTDPVDPPGRRGWPSATGFFGTRIAVVPVRGASLLGDDVVVAHDRHTITTAPTVDIVVDVDPSQQQLLIDHYARPTPAATAADTTKEDT